MVTIAIGWKTHPTPLTRLGFSRLGHARFSLSSEVRDNTQHALDQHDLAAVMHLVLLYR